MVVGDIFPDLVTKYSDFLAIPLTSIFNEIVRTSLWPLKWKVEYVTVNPKNSDPQGFGDLRNISCTKLFSKIMESFVLQWASQEVSCKFNQFGGVKKCSGTHMLIQIWQKILANLKDRRAGTVLTSIDYAKAFNRLSYQHCLKAFAKQGASTAVLRLIATFLTGRSMSVRVSSTWSSLRMVSGGCPQGSILGVLLFNLTTDDLEEGSDYVEPAYRPDLQPPVGLAKSDIEHDLSQELTPTHKAVRPANRGWGAGSLSDEEDAFFCNYDSGTNNLISTPTGGSPTLLFTPSPVAARP